MKHNILASWLQGMRKEHMPALGHRELEVLEHLWQQERLTAAQLLDCIGREHITLNTVQSTLERLYRKKLIERNKIGRAYHYAAVLSRADIVSRVLQDLMRDVGGGELAPIISGFAGFVAAEDDDTERKLFELLNAAERRDD
ncbi:MAG: BlaI/MecI/CopY family transcriptional regulator [Pseudomonadales bacterium]